MKKPDLATDFCGIRSPNPFWLASGPPTNSAYQVRRAFEAGWGGVVWKTLAHDPVVNVSARYGAVDYHGRKMMGLNNIELISDRSLEENLREITEIKQEFPDRAMIVSLMVESKKETWQDIVQRTEDAGCDGLELNFGCPHGMSERGMGAAVGQVPEYTEMITGWVTEVAKTPVLVKLTPNVADPRPIGQAARRAGAAGLSLINTINSIMGVDLETLHPMPHVGGRGSHGGYCGPAVKPIALNMLQQVAADPAIDLPISGIGGIESWQDAAEFLLLGATSVQVCTAAMHHGFRIVEPMISGLQMWMLEHEFESLSDVQGRVVPDVGGWGELDLAYKVVAEIDQDQCIHCGLCYIACEDGAHQSIHCAKIETDAFLAQHPNGAGAVHQSGGKNYLPGAGAGYVNLLTIDQTTCVGCNLCSLVCPVEDCISMVERDSGLPSMTWNEYQEKLGRGEVDPIAPPEHR